MKRFVTLLLFVLSVGSALRAQQPVQKTTELQPQQSSQPGDGNEPTASKVLVVVSDINFGYRPVGLAALISNPFSVVNRGDGTLRVTKMSGLVPSSMSAVYDISDITGTSFPFTVNTISSGDNEHRFSIKFTPNKVGTFDATITFSSNATGVDSVCRLHGFGINPGIGCNAIDFGRKRVGGTYSADQFGSASQLMISNSLGGTNSTISKVTISGDVTEFDHEDLSALNGLSMAPAQQIIKGITFTPHKVGYDTLRITMTVSTGSPITFVATGIGVQPKLQLPDIDFGQVDLGDTATATSTKTFTIVNLDNTTTPAYEFYDDLLFSDAGSLSAMSEIGTGGKASVGSQGFSFDVNAFDLPLFIGAGLSSPVFSAWYQPTAVGSNMSTFQLQDQIADTVYSAKWTGSAIKTSAAVADNTTISGCSPNPVRDELHLSFVNPMQGELIIRSALGIEVGRQPLMNADHLRVPMSSYPSGMYLLEIVDCRGVSAVRVLKD